MVGRILTITRSADFERVLAQPARSRSAHFAVHHVADRPTLPAGRAAKAVASELSTGDAPSCPPLVDETPLAGCWLGTVVPKRHARRAATRNLLKRQIRALMGDSAARLAPGLWVVRLKAPFDRQQFPSAASQPLRIAARVELAALLQRAAQPSPPSGKR
ncbi:ribonuclease P protein component [Aquincola sp. S2]|uniref:Ribonuclease P protein component n=1 Tax=Pseudaquabacterium terrae TaxID=2732868 RepID=A0ABX2EKX4_9BURK|nr:ribonuclease P protein component [Aquabacterium terrae]NRF69288.1 ribonuclease P protein component [Aquabacterium terrae]